MGRPHPCCISLFIIICNFGPQNEHSSESIARTVSTAACISSRLSFTTSGPSDLLDHWSAVCYPCQLVLRVSWNENPPHSVSGWLPILLQDLLRSQVACLLAAKSLYYTSHVSPCLCTTHTSHLHVQHNIRVSGPKLRPCSDPTYVLTAGGPSDVQLIPSRGIECWIF